MLRTLVIPLAPCALPSWSGPGFQFHCASDCADGIQWLAQEPCDLVLLVAQGAAAGTAQACARVEAALGADVVPLVLAAPGSDLEATRALEALPFDAFVDLGWPVTLVQRVLMLAVQRVRAGRGVAEIQHQVLRAVREEVAQLKDHSLRDELTGLFNLRSFREVVGREHAHAQRRGRGYALVCFDLDDLRQLNTVHGHAVGTRALHRFGLSLQTLTPPSDYTFRVGGDEFVTLLLDADRASAQRYAERVCKALRLCVVEVEQGHAELSVSAGVAVFPRDGEGVEAVLARADAALLQAKALGRGRVMLCEGAS
jgi:diguanylate cyclase (GGDEF)-like protein